MSEKSPALSAHLHAHHTGDARYRHVAENRQGSILAGAVVLTLGFAFVEFFTGWKANSLALISDAGHMLTDASALLLALFAQYIAKRPPSEKNSFGYGRAEALAAFVNGLLMLAMTAWIAIEALHRLSDPQPVQGMMVLLVAALGLCVNLLVAWLLSRDRKSLNTRAALVHVMGDLLGSVAALAAGAVIYFYGWLAIDPLLSLFVCALLLKSTISILLEAYHFLMEGVPANIDYVQVGADIARVDGVVSVHDLHVWEMSPGEPALTGHVEVSNLVEWPQTLQRIRDMLGARYGIEHITMQAEPVEV